MIIVFGSINMDVNMRLASFPKPGETILAPSYDMSPGGKGANQALAAARSGVKTAIVGKVGDDVMGTRILNNLRRYEVMTSGVATSDTLPTGMAFVMGDSSGENQIIVASGANADVSAGQVPDEVLSPGNVVLLQMELPPAENQALLERAKARGVTTILNLAPAIRITQKMLDHVDYLVVNEHEAHALAEALGIPANKDMMMVARALSLQGGLTCVITLGEHGSIAASVKEGNWRVPAMSAKVMDTTGAGDCYCGTLAAAIHSQFALDAAMRRASVAASLSCQQKGAQDSYPFLADIESVLESFPQAQAS
jgi:ribokinase